MLIKNLMMMMVSKYQDRNTCTFFFWYGEDYGWMTCDFASFKTVFQSYQDNVWMIIEGSRPSFTAEKVQGFIQVFWEGAFFCKNWDRNRSFGNKNCRSKLQNL